MLLHYDLMIHCIIFLQIYKRYLLLNIFQCHLALIKIHLYYTYHLIHHLIHQIHLFIVLSTLPVKLHSLR